MTVPFVPGFAEICKLTQEAGDDAWEDLKQGAENAWNALRDSFSKAKSEFKRGYRRGLEE